VRSVAQAAWQAPARLPAQLNAPHAHQSARFTACSTSRQPAAGGSTERSAGRQPGRRLETERTPGKWYQNVITFWIFTQHQDTVVSLQCSDTALEALFFLR